MVAKAFKRMVANMLWMIEKYISQPIERRMRIILTHVRVTATIKVQGRIYRIPIEYGIGSANKSFHAREPNVSKAIGRLLNERGGAVIDVGANIGQTLLSVYNLDSSRRYIGYEPNPACATYVERLCRVNCIFNASIVACGLGGTSKIVPLYIRDGFSDTASMVKNFRPQTFYSRHINVPIMPGDLALSFIDDLEEICFIKVDVEGAELEVLSGLRKTIEVNTPPIIFEVLPDRIFMTGETLNSSQAAVRSAIANGIEELLTSLGYSINRILKDGSLTTIKSLERERDVPMVECNYVAIPGSAHR